ncbi:MAG: restriction endonuclease subunit S [Treponema sp.]|nr:restriction endonuclease subunit S [Treponema sp.]
MENGKLKKYKLGEIAYFVDDKISSDEISLNEYITTDCLLQNKKGRSVATNLPPQPCSLTKFKRGDILIGNIRPYLKKIWLADIDGGSSLDVLVLRAKDKNKSAYLYSVLMQDSFYDFVMKAPKGSKMPRGDKNHILTFPCSNVNHKIEIGNFIKSLDDKIALNRRMNEKLTAMAKRLYDHWFVQFDFPNADGKPYKASGGKMVWNETLKREIPAGWEVKRLGEFLDCNKNSMSSESDYKYINYLDTSSLTENLINGIAKIHQDYPSRAKRIVNKNDILFSTVRPAQHHFGIIKKPVKNMIASTGFAILSCKYGSEYNEFFYQFITSTENIEKLDSIANLNASSYPSINPSDILDLKITLPHEISELKPFIDKVSAIFELVDSRQRETQKLTALRDRLLPLLMNGQVEVR